jgi:hypothetical protein
VYSSLGALTRRRQSGILANCRTIFYATSRKRTAPMTTSQSNADLMTRPSAAAVTSEHTLKIEAARAGVGVGEYQARLRQGLLWCYRCQDWHQADAFPADARRHSGRAGSCHQAIRAAARDALTSRGQLPPPAGVWVIRRPGSASPPRPGAQLWAYWRGPGRGATPGPDRATAWSPALGRDVARFPGPGQARDALITAFGGAGAVPSGCRLVRLA